MVTWNRISDWLPIVFHFGTENWEEQLKKNTLYIDSQSYHYIFQICQLDYIYDTLLVETIYNKTLPEWTKVKAIC